MLIPTRYFVLFWVLSSTSTPFVLCQNNFGNISCAGSDSDWYTNIVGETPCKTYARLRKICEGNYQVGQMNPNTPPDQCIARVPANKCCCNWVAFSLSMLCLGCQQGSGKDAGAGAYQDYLGQCAPVNNVSLPDSVHNAVCDQQIRIFDDLYRGFGGLGWNDGQWFYGFMQQRLLNDTRMSNNNTFTQCNQAVFGGGPNPNSSSGSNKGSKNPGLSGGAIGGIVAGVVVFVGLLAGLGFYLWKKHRRHQKEIKQMFYSRADPSILVGDQSPPNTGQNDSHVQDSGVSSKRRGQENSHIAHDQSSMFADEPERPMFNRPPPAYDESIPPEEVMSGRPDSSTAEMSTNSNPAFVSTSRPVKKGEPKGIDS